LGKKVVDTPNISYYSRSILTKQTRRKMSNSKSARTSSIMSNVKNGVYIRMAKFAHYGSVVEDSIKAQQRQADRRLLEIQAKKAKTGCNIINGLRYKEARDFKETHDSAMSTMKQATFNQKVWGQC
jgi:hypothetical protein